MSDEPPVLDPYSDPNVPIPYDADPDDVVDASDDGGIPEFPGAWATAAQYAEILESLARHGFPRDPNDPDGSKLGEAQ